MRVAQALRAGAGPVDPMERRNTRASEWPLWFGFMATFNPIYADKLSDENFADGRLLVNAANPVANSGSSSGYRGREIPAWKARRSGTLADVRTNLRDL